MNSFLLRFNGYAVYTACVVLLSTCQAKQTWGITHIGTASRDISHRSDVALHGISYNSAGHGTIEGRETRALTGAAKSVAALEKILTSAKKVNTQAKSYRLYRKEGTLQTAMDDFYSVEPVLKRLTPINESFVFRRRGRTNTSLIGHVGNTRLILLTQGDRFSKYEPVLEIRSTTESVFDRIVYKSKGN